MKSRARYTVVQLFIDTDISDFERHNKRCLRTYVISAKQVALGTITSQWFCDKNVDQKL